MTRDSAADSSRSLRMTTGTSIERNEFPFQGLFFSRWNYTVIIAPMSIRQWLSPFSNHFAERSRKKTKH
jgi:hypothetical protein